MFLLYATLCSVWGAREILNRLASSTLLRRESLLLTGEKMKCRENKAWWAWPCDHGCLFVEKASLWRRPRVNSESMRQAPIPGIKRNSRSCSKSPVLQHHPSQHCFFCLHLCNAHHFSNLDGKGLTKAQGTRGTRNASSRAHNGRKARH